jgi:hypothetical protein
MLKFRNSNPSWKAVSEQFRRSQYDEARSIEK